MSLPRLSVLYSPATNDKRPPNFCSRGTRYFRLYESGEVEEKVDQEVEKKKQVLFTKLEEDLGQVKRELEEQASVVHDLGDAK